MNDGPSSAQHRDSPRALWVVPVSDIGGVARHVLDALGAGIPGWRTSLLTPPGPLATACTDAGIDVVTGAFGPAYGLASSWRTLRSAVGRVQPRVLHSHLSYADIVCSLLPTRSIRLLSTEHGIAAHDLVYHGSTLEGRCMAVAHRIRLRRLAAQIAVSRATERAIRDKWKAPRKLELRVIPNGIDPGTPTTPSAESGLRIATLSRLAPEKGLVDLVDAFAKVRADHPEARLDIAGTGPDEAIICRRVATHDLGESVRFRGVVDGLAGLGPVDVVAQLSVWENCSYTILDAVTAGCGVVATDVGGNPEVLPEHCLTPVGATDVVAARLVEQGTDPARRPTLPAGWPTVQAMCHAVGELYDEVAA